MIGHSRRALLVGAVGVTAAGALPAVAAQLPVGRGMSSTELLAWRETRAAYWTAEGACIEYQQKMLQELDLEAIPMSARDRDRRLSLDTPEYKALEETVGVNEDRLDACVAALRARPIRSWQDVAELAEMVRGEMRWNPGDRHEDDDLAPDPMVSRLFDAIAQLASGGPATC